jgi:hypothetical protein
MSQPKRNKGYIKTFVVGDRVEIRRGTFKGKVGTVSHTWRGIATIQLDPRIDEHGVRHEYAWPVALGFGSLVHERKED